MIYCPRCGQENDDSYESCLKCRRDLVKAKTGEKKDFNCLKCSWPVFNRWIFCPKCKEKLEIKKEEDGEAQKQSEPPEAPEPKMYCRNCGKKINEKAEICVYCGVRPLAEKKFCQECGVATNTNQELCIKCGVWLKPLMYINESGSPIPIRTDISGLPRYYQDEFEKIYESNETYQGKWNWAAFFFGPIWALIQGVWLAPLISFVALIATGGVAGVIYGFIFAIRGNYMYYSAYVKNKQLPI